MRFCKIHDLTGRAVLCKQFQHPLSARVFAAARQFAVGKRPCAALAEHDVAFRVKHACRPKTFNGLHTLLHRSSAFQHQWTISLLRQGIRGKQPGRAESRNDNASATILHSLRDFRIRFGTARFDPIVFSAERLLFKFLGKRYRYVVQITDLLLFARIQRAPRDPKRQKRIRRHTTQFRRLLLQFLLRRRIRQPKSRQFKHSPFLLAERLPGHPNRHPGNRPNAYQFLNTDAAHYRITTDTVLTVRSSVSSTVASSLRTKTESGNS